MLVAVIVAVLGGAVILFPSLVLLFRLTLGGRLGHGHEEPAAAPVARRELVLAAAPGPARPRRRGAAWWPASGC